MPPHLSSIFFFFNDTATTEIYTLSLHDALPIFSPGGSQFAARFLASVNFPSLLPALDNRSEEHTSELQSQSNLVCRLLLEKKKKKNTPVTAQVLITDLLRDLAHHDVIHLCYSAV